MSDLINLKIDDKIQLDITKSQFDALCEAIEKAKLYYTSQIEDKKNDLFSATAEQMNGS